MFERANRPVEGQFARSGRSARQDTLGVLAR